MKVFLAILIICVASFALLQVFKLRNDFGENQRLYSTYRTDPSGCSLLFEMLRDLNPQSAIQNVYNLKLGDFDPAQDTFVLLGKDHRVYQDRDNGSFYHPEEEYLTDRLEEGAELILALFNPRQTALPELEEDEEEEAKEEAAENKEEANPDKDKDEEEVDLLKGLWWVDAKEKQPPFYRAPVVLDPSPRRFRLAVDETWEVVRKDKQGFPYVVRKSYGTGSVNVMASNYYLSNEAILGNEPLEIINLLFPKGRRYVFEEGLGFSYARNQGIMKLLLGMGLGPAIALLGVTLILFIWKLFRPLVTYPNNQRELALEITTSNDQALQSLLCKHLSPKEVLGHCVEEAKQLQKFGQHKKNITLKHPQEMSKDPWKAYNEQVK